MPERVITSKQAQSIKDITDLVVPVANSDVKTRVLTGVFALDGELAVIYSREIPGTGKSGVRLPEKELRLNCAPTVVSKLEAAGVFKAKPPETGKPADVTSKED